MRCRRARCLRPSTVASQGSSRPGFADLSPPRLHQREANDHIACFGARHPGINQWSTTNCRGANADGRLDRGTTACPRVRTCAAEPFDGTAFHESPHHLPIGVRAKHSRGSPTRNRGSIPACDVRVSPSPPSVARIAPASGLALKGSSSFCWRRDLGNSKRCAVMALRACNGAVGHDVQHRHVTAHWRR
jgi:hypothetical protein